MSSKYCNKCKINKPEHIAYYYKRSDTGKLRGTCIQCTKKTHRNWRYNNKEGVKKHGRTQVLKQYNLDEKGYSELLINQDCECAICGVHQDDLKRNLCVDHCHKTGRNRGLLCSLCNTGIGKLGDDAESLHKAYTYLKRSEEIK